MADPITQVRLDRDDPVPLYHQLVGHLRRHAEKLSPGDRFPTEMTIARRFDVSRYTVNKALDQLVTDGLLTRVQGSGTFVQDHDADRPDDRTRLGNVVLFMKSGISQLVSGRDYVNADLLQGVLDGIGDRANVVFCHIPPEADETSLILSRLTDPGTLGTVLLEWKGIDRIVETATRLRKAFVLLNVKDSQFTNRNRVMAREQEGMTELTKYLLSRGHRRMLYLGEVDLFEMDADPVMLRYKAFLARVRDAGIDLAPESYLNVKGLEADDLATKLEPHLAGPNRPTALVAGSDMVVRPIYDALRRLGLSVPGDISVTGFDDAPFAAKLTPALTTVVKPRHAMGRRAAEMLLEQIEDGFTVEADQWVDCSLAIRDSVSEPTVT